MDSLGFLEGFLLEVYMFMDGTHKYVLFHIENLGYKFVLQNGKKGSQGAILQMEVKVQVNSEFQAMRCTPSCSWTLKWKFMVNVSAGQ